MWLVASADIEALGCTSGWNEGTEDADVDAAACVDGPAAALAVCAAAFARRFCSCFAREALRRWTLTNAASASTASMRYCLLGLSASLMEQSVCSETCPRVV